ncbi:MAG: FAD-binding oxidoreductase, partial [Actinomycetes bacterium]
VQGAGRNFGPPATSLFSDGDVAEIDVATVAYANGTTGRTGTTKPLPGLVLEILRGRDPPDTLIPSRSKKEIMTTTSLEDLSRRLDRELGTDRVARPGDPRYAGATAVWNAAVTARPALVVRPRTSAEVSVAVIAASETGTGVSVRGGGHDWVGRALRDGGLVIDLDGMRDVRIEHDTARVGGGSRSADLVAAASGHGLNAATGTSGQVGLAGLTLGGGYGPLLGTAGLATDNLLGAEVVLADGRIVSTEDDPELLWALQGGGGNFGVVTGLRVQLHPDRGLVGGMVLFAWAEAATVLQRYAELLADPVDGLTLLVELCVVPDVRPCLLVVPVWSGEPGGADEA